jgi:hypothetical protein
MKKAGKRARKLSRLPGSNELVRSMPQAIIAQNPHPGNTAGTRDNRERYLTFALSGRHWVDPLTGWTASDDPMAQVKLKFPIADSAIRFVESQGWNYVLQDQLEPENRPAPPLSFLAETKSKPIHYPKSQSQEQRLNSDKVQSDEVEVAGLLSFPASDPPTWIGTSI